ncbi:FAD-dependent oxidoreductase [Streptomyces sp. NPDC020096]
MSCDVIVIGGGVIGLTTAIRLAESGARVRVWSRDPVDRTTSAIAGALWEPYRIEPQDRVAAWSRRTFEVLAELAERPAETGVRLVPGLQALDGDLPLPYWADTVPGLRPAEPDELPPGYKSGFRARLPLVDMPTHLDYLSRRLTAAGGTLEHRTATSLAEAARHAPRIVNCTGLAARDLVPDPRVRPVRGQIVIVENPGLTEWFVRAGDEDTEAVYLFPQPYGLLLGGTAHEGVWDTTPDPAEAAAIINRCALIDPRVSTARVLRHRAGLRPVRDEVRLEREELPIPKGAVCVHNYAHGGAGITVSWGCADEAAGEVWR